MMLSKCCCFKVAEGLTTKNVFGKHAKVNKLKFIGVKLAVTRKIEYFVFINLIGKTLTAYTSNLLLY